MELAKASPLIQTLGLKLNKRLAVTVLGILLWLSVLPDLFLLPPTEVAQTIQLFKKTIAENPELTTSSITESEWKIYMREYIAKPQDQENILWIKWVATLSLISIAIIAWVLFYVRKPISKWYVLITSLIFILINTVFSPNTFSGFSSMVLHGGLHLLPWQMITSTIFYHAVMPLLFVILTIMVFKERF